MGKAKKKAEAEAKAEESIALGINGHTLTGEKRGDEWTFACPSWPELAEKWRGDTVTGNIIDEFVRRCLAGAITVKRLAAGD